MKKAVKIVFVVLIILVLLITVLVISVFNMTSGLVDSADRFFLAIEQNDYQKAYDQLSQDFKASTDFQQFETFLQNTALVNYKSASWTSRSISDSIGELEGSVTTKDGGKVPVNIKLVEDKDQWKILSLTKEPAGLLTEAPDANPMPMQQELMHLLKKSMYEFALALNNKDFTDFHNNISRLWQSQTTKDQLYNAFKTFSDQDVDLTVLQNIDPVFSEKPYINENKLLILKGYYPSQPSVTYFELMYLYEHPEWKLASIDIQLK